MSDNNADIEREKTVQYYSGIVNAWVSTKLERDKSLLTLSAGGIGLLVTLLTTVGSSCLLIIIFYLFSISGFVICLISLISIFNRNAVYLTKVVNEGIRYDIRLKKLDKIALCSFILAVIFSIIIGISIGIENFQKNKEGMMTDENTTKKIVKSEKATTKEQKINKFSLDGITDLDPKKQVSKDNQDNQSLQQDKSNKKSDNKKK